MKKLTKKKRITAITLLLLLIIIIIVIIFNQVKPLPSGTSYEGDIHHVDEVTFLSDLTYRSADDKTIYEQHIFKEVFQMIDEAEEIIVIDMFLFNAYKSEPKDYIKLSDGLTAHLLKKKEEKRDIEIVFITDPINNGYHSYVGDHIKHLEDHDIDVILTNLSALRDSNPVYSAVWRSMFQVFGQRGPAWIPNLLAEDAPDMTMRSYLELFNVKANHRKAVITEKAALVASANAHDESGFNSNIAFKVSGEIIYDFLEAEQAVIDFSNEKHKIKMPEVERKSGDIAVQYVTEGKILKHILKEIEETKADETIWLGMFYLADKQVIDALKEASDRGVKVSMILDPNEVAFGSEKIGLPNLPVASKLIKEKNIDVRWYEIDEEQYHTKMMYIQKPTEGVIIGGSANYTTRNLDDYNIESTLKIIGPIDEKVFTDVDAYFNRLWTNDDGIFTSEYEKHEKDYTPLLKLTYWVQKLSGLTTY